MRGSNGLHVWTAAAADGVPVDCAGWSKEEARRWRRRASMDFTVAPEGAWAAFPWGLVTDFTGEYKGATDSAADPIGGDRRAALREDNDSEHLFRGKVLAQAIASDDKRMRARRRKLVDYFELEVSHAPSDTASVEKPDS